MNRADILRLFSKDRVNCGFEIARYAEMVRTDPRMAVLTADMLILAVARQDVCDEAIAAIQQLGEKENATVAVLAELRARLAALEGIGEESNVHSMLLRTATIVVLKDTIRMLEMRNA